MRTSSKILSLTTGLCLSSFALAQAPGLVVEEANLPEPQVVYLPNARAADAVTAQPTKPNKPDLTRPSMFHAVGLHELDGHLVGLGPRYDVEFDQGGFTFTPGLGGQAPRSYPLTFAVESFGRGAAREAVSRTEPVKEGFTAYFNRPEFVESYEMRLDGVKQSFTFHRLPQGTGDLIVRGRVQINLQGVPGDGGIVFSDGAFGGVRLGKVIGIDANGTRVEGSMRYDGGVLEMTLGSEFVDGAALPLVLDPLVSAELGVRVSTTLDDQDPDIAYDQTNDVFLVVWEYLSSGTNGQIRGRLVDPAGNFVGGALAIDSSAASDLDPSVANVTTEDAFCVVWRSSIIGPDPIIGRAFRADTAAIGARTTIFASATDNYSIPDVGGEAVADNEAIVVSENTTQDEIHAKQVTVDGDVTPPTLSPFSATVTIGGSGTISWNQFSPAISKSGGNTGQHLIVWNRQSTGNLTKVRGAIVSRNLSILDTEIQVSGSLSSAYDDDDPDVDGNGRDWVVAWERSEDTTGTSTDDDIVCRGVRYDSNASSGNQGHTPGPIIVIEAGAGDDEQDVAVAWAGSAALVAFEDESGSRFDSEIHSLDPFSCTRCEGIFGPFAGARDEQDPAICSQFSGQGDSVDRPLALVVVESTDTATGDGDILARTFRSDDGRTAYLGGSCGSAGGIIYASCARRGNADFRFLQRDGDPSVTTWLVFSFTTIDIPCGSCTLRPDPFTGFVFPASNNARGDSEINLAIPSSSALTGLVAYAQWLTMDTTSPSCTTWSTDLSAALRVEIQ